MEKEHEQFFLELLELCAKHKAEIGKGEEGDLNFGIDGARFETSEVRMRRPLVVRPMRAYEFRHEQE